MLEDSSQVSTELRPLFNKLKTYATVIGAQWYTSTFFKGSTKKQTCEDSFPD